MAGAANPAAPSSTPSRRTSRTNRHIAAVLNAYNHQLHQALAAISAQPATDLLAQLDQLAGIEGIGKVITSTTTPPVERRRHKLTATPQPDTADQVADVLVAERQAHPEGDLSAFIAAALWAAAWELSTVAHCQAVTDDGDARLEPVPISDFLVGAGFARLISMRPESREASVLTTWAKNGNLVPPGPADTRDRIAELAKILASPARANVPVGGDQLLSDACRTAAGRLGGPKTLMAGVAWFPEGLARMLPDAGGSGEGSGQ